MKAHSSATCSVCMHETYEEFQHTCLHEAIEMNRVIKETHKLSIWPRWDYQMDDATLIFSQDGKPRIVCAMEVAGSTRGDTWQWSWGNPHLPEACRSRTSIVHDYGQERNWERMTKLFLPNDEYVGWECASIANHLLGGMGVYRCPNSDSKWDDHLMDAVYVVILSAEFVI